MPTANHDEENTYDLQAGTSRRTAANRGRRGRKASSPRQDSNNNNTSSSSSSSAGSREGEEDDDWMSDASEDLFPDVSVPEPDDIVRLRPEAAASYTPMFLSSTPPTTQMNPLYMYGVRIGIVRSPDDLFDAEIPEDNNLVPVEFFAVDDRASAVPFRRIELVNIDDLEVLCRPFTPAELVVADGDVGIVDEVEMRVGVKRVPFPKWLKAIVPPTLDLHYAELVAPVDTALDHSKGDVDGDEGAAKEGVDGEPEEHAAKHQDHHHRFKSKSKRKPRLTEQNKQDALKMQNAIRRLKRPPMSQTFAEYLDTLTYIPNARLAPVNPFRPEVCVVDRSSQLVGMALATQRGAIIAFPDGAVCVCSNLVAALAKGVADVFEADLIYPSRGVRFNRKHGAPYLHFIVGDYECGCDDEGVREGVCIVEIPLSVHCSFTTDAGVTWDVGPYDCHPSQLVPLDYYYAEFVNPLGIGFHVDAAMLEKVRRPMRAAVQEGREAARQEGLGGPSAEVCLAALEAEFETRDELFAERMEAVKARPFDLIDHVDDEMASTLNICGDLVEEVAKAEREGGAERAQDPQADEERRVPPKPSKEKLQAMLRHLSRDNADNGGSICGSLSPLEYASLYEHICPPATLPQPAAQLPFPSPTSYPMPLDDESLPRWREFLGRLLAFLPHIVTVRSIESYATVAWNSGRIDYRLDGRKLMLRMEPEENDIAPPPEATRLVGPSAVRASSFPIDMVPSKRHVTERVGEYDLMVQLPEDHYAPSPGDVVMMKCRDDHERERQYDNWAETVRIVGRVLETNEKDRLCVVHWSPAELNVDVSNPESFPEYSEPDATDPLVAAAAAVCPIVGKLLIGGVIRSLPNATAVVKWWNGNVEVVPMPLLNTVRFDELENQQAEGEEGEEEEQEDEDVVEEPPQASPTASHQDPNSASMAGSGPVGSFIKNVSNAFRRAFGANQSEEKGAEAESNPTTPTAALPEAGEGATENGTVAEPSAISAFSFVATFSGHIFADEAEGLAPAEPKRYVKRIQAEWKLLQKDMPAGVSVKASEEQMHFLKILVRGPIHTPYYQGVYAFDLFFPPEFPTTPPKVKFHAYQIRMNPNLYDNGYVCLSLLGTWQGQHSTEEWNPASSNVVQVIHALQAMVLCKEPYFNEPGFETSQGTEKGRVASRVANEGYYLMKLEHQSKMLAKPPPDWVFEVRQHAREFMPRILARARRYLEPQQAPLTSADGSAAAATAAEVGPTGTPPPPAEGAINSDGLVMPLSRGFHLSLGRHVAAVAKQFDEQQRRWNAEETSHDAAVHGGGKDGGGPD
jgi:ubiquitin-protein ligase